MRRDPGARAESRAHRPLRRGDQPPRARGGGRMTHPPPVHRSRRFRRRKPSSKQRGRPPSRRRVTRPARKRACNFCGNKQPHTTIHDDVVICRRCYVAISVVVHILVLFILRPIALYVVLLWFRVVGMPPPIDDGVVLEFT